MIGPGAAFIIVTIVTWLTIRVIKQLFKLILIMNKKFYPFIPVVGIILTVVNFKEDLLNTGTIFITSAIVQAISLSLLFRIFF